MSEERAGATVGRFPGVRPRPVTSRDTVQVGPLAGATLPLVFQATVGGMNLATWAAGAGQRAMIEERLRQHGGLLFRGFQVQTVEDFRAFAVAISSKLVSYSERSSPRTQMSEGVYTSTDHPHYQPILLHTEQSYTLDWPMKIMFFCRVAPQAGGRTPIADTRRILSRLDPAIVERFTRKEVMYIRNYNQGLGLPWQEVFQTEDPRVVSAHCEEAGISYEWLGGGRLRTRQVRPAVRRHPVTGEAVWFNHALFFHVSGLTPEVRAAMLAAVTEEELPYMTSYGDGSPIEPETLDALRAAYEGEQVSFPWQAGDVLLLDNMLAAHGRESFTPPRVVLTVMADPFSSVAGAAPTADGGEPA